MIRGFDVNQTELVEAVADKMRREKVLSPPAWASFVKTSPAKDRVPSQQDWWYIRGASILRRFYMDNRPKGVNRLRVVYGDKTKNRYSGKHFMPASGAAIRKIMQQLEAYGLTKKVKVDKHYGRRITPAGISFIDAAAKSIEKSEK
ncbi:40S ribosomal protein S19 [Candidatus Parvarchaeota archaeon]|nr:40S ribosomal protein S19 [Candidatus Parvarchaeota archaeon]